MSNRKALVLVYSSLARIFAAQENLPEALLSVNNVANAASDEEDAKVIEQTAAGVANDHIRTILAQAAEATRSRIARAN